MDAGEDDTPPLLRAAYAGDVHALRRAIADGADLNVEGFQGNEDLYPNFRASPPRSSPQSSRSGRTAAATVMGQYLII